MAPSRASQAPTLKDVANAAGVPTQTVSAVVNEMPGISQPTRDRVLQAIQELGYPPFNVAPSLRTRKTHSIALFVSDIAAQPLGAMASAIGNYVPHLIETCRVLGIRPIVIAWICCP
jgi:LacI family transcriptional regulator